MKKSGFPEGWDEDRVRRVLEHYEQQTEHEAVAEDEAVQYLLFSEADLKGFQAILFLCYL